jgi:O-antigen/teichoic acid export membrane protein
MTQATHGDSLGRGITLLTISNAGSAVLSFGLSALIGRGLGPNGFGAYATALAWVYPLSLAAEFGLGTLLTRDAAQNRPLEGLYLRHITQARLLMGGGLMLALIVLAPMLSADAGVIAGLRLSAPLILILPLFGQYTAIFRARQAMWPIPPLNLGMLAAQIALTVLAFALGGGLPAAFAVNTLTSAGQVVAAWWLWRRRFPPPPSAPDSTITLVGLLRRAWPFAAAALLAAVQARMGAVLLERLTDTAQAGWYAAAGRFVEAARVLPNAAFGAILPRLSALNAQGSQRLFLRTAALITGYALLAALVGNALAAPIISLTYGAGYEASTAALRLSLWGLLPLLLRAALTLYAYATHREGLTNAVTLGVIGVQVALGLMWIPAQGAAGAAGSLLAAEACGAAALALLLLRNRS